MILTIRDNGQILKKSPPIHLNDFVVLTGENGAGKTQLLRWLRDYRYEHYFDEEIRSDEFGNTVDTDGKPVAPIQIITSDAGIAFTDIIYSNPGLKFMDDYGNPNQSPDFLQNIRSEWGEIELAIISLRSIKHLKFDTPESQLTALNSKMADIVRRSVLPGNGFQPEQFKLISIISLNKIFDLAKLCNKQPSDLTFIDFLILYNIPQDLFSPTLGLLFHQFYLKNIYYPYLTEGIKPPWILFNEILETARFNYRTVYINSKNEESPDEVKLLSNDNNIAISFNDLSSGESTIMALIFALYSSSNNGKFPEVILFDEPDAHLHPSLADLFLNVVKDTIVRKNGVKVIMTTHSPSTVALAPEESIYLMNKEYIPVQNKMME